jgi:hypothetical protein
MLIQNINKYVNQIVHNGETHKVVEGFADVPNEVAEHLLSYPDWSQVVEPIEQKIINELHGIEEVAKEKVAEPKEKDKKDNDSKETK